MPQNEWYYVTKHLTVLFLDFYKERAAGRRLYERKSPL
jgi:hypothetical protein